MDIFSIIGWFGLVMMISAYYMVSNEYLSPTGYKYQSLNLIGALFLGISAIALKNWPIVILEFFYMLISIKTIFKPQTKKG